MFNFTIHSKGRTKMPVHNFMYNKFDVKFVDVMTRYHGFKRLNKEMKSDFKPNTSNTLPLFEELSKLLD